jgi:hypothetical protein
MECGATVDDVQNGPRELVLKKEAKEMGKTEWVAFISVTTTCFLSRHSQSD